MKHLFAQVNGRFGGHVVDTLYSVMDLRVSMIDKSLSR